MTQAFRPVGALLFGMLADRYGRRPVLMFNILSFSVIELACAFAPSLSALLVLRALFGIAMGGEWGVGAALVFETLPKEGPRHILRHSAGGLRAGVDSGVGGLRASCSSASAGGGCLFSAPCRRFWCSMCRQGGGVAGMACRGTKARGALSATGLAAPILPPNLMAFLPTFLFLDPADDGVHELFARHAGCVSDISCGARPGFRRRRSG